MLKQTVLSQLVVLVLDGHVNRPWWSVSWLWFWSWSGGDLRQNGRQGEELGGQVGQVDQQEDEERLDDPNLLGETSDEAEDDSEHQTH